MVVMKIKLYKDSAGALHAEFLDGLNSVSQNNSNVNGVLVMLDNFDLMPEEVLRIAYELESGAEVDDYTLMEDNGDGTYSTEVPPAVTRSDVGTEWFLGLQIASNWVENDDYTGYLYKQNLVERLKFKVNNAVKDLNGKYPNRGDLTALYQEAQKKIAHEENNAQEIENVKETIATAPLALISPIDFAGKAINEYSFSSFATTWFNRQPRVGDTFYAVGVNVGEDERSYYLLCQIENHDKEENTVSATCYQTLPVVGGKLVEAIKNNSSSISIQSEKIQAHSEAIGKNSNAIREVSTEVSNANNDIFLMRMQLQETTAQHVSDIEGLRQDIINESHFRGYFLNNVDVQNTQGNANDYAYSAESGTKWIYNATVGHWLDSGVPVPAGGVPASNATPLMDGEASAGQEGAYARGDHRHPSDTSKVSKTGDTMTGQLSVAKDDYNKTTLENGGVTIEDGDPYMPDQFPTRYSHSGINHDGRTIHFPQARWKDPTEDDPTVEKLDETLVVQSDLEPITDKLDTVEEISQELAVINLTFEQSGLVKKYKQPITQEYNERVTANGANVLDGSKAVLKKVVGSTVACKNLIPYPYSFTEKTERGLTFTVNADGSIKVSGTSKASGRVVISNTFKLSAGTYYHKGRESTEQYYTYIGKLDGTILAVKASFTLTEETEVILGHYFDQNLTINKTYYPMLNEGTTELPYQPYFTGLKSASFAGIESTNADGTETSGLICPKTETPLGVTIDFENKKITDYGVEIDGNYPNISYSSSSSLFTFSGLTALIADRTKAVSSHYTYDNNGTSVRNGTFWITSDGTDLRVRDNRFTSVDELKAWMAENNVTIRYVSSVLQSETDFTADNEYTAYKGGTETVFENDGAEFGAENTLTQDYILVTEVK